MYSGSAAATLARIRSRSTVSQPAPSAGRHIAHQALAQLWQVRRHHDSLPDAGVNRDGRADLAQFDAEAADLHLFVGAADELDVAVGVATRQVARTVQPARRA